MEYTAQLLNPRKLVAPAVALVIGAAGAVGAYALIDDTDVGVQPAQVIVTKSPAGTGPDAKHEASTAAAIAGSGTPSFSKDEANTAAAIAGGSDTPSFTKNEANTAAAIAGGEAQVPQSGPYPSPAGIPSPAATAALEEQERELRSDPHGYKSLLPR
jgi:hypothetical protein